MRDVTVLKAIVGNYALQSSFEVKIPNLPGSAGANLVEFFATGVDTPESDTEDTIPVYWRGRKGEMPASGKTYGDLTLMCNIDANMALYDQLYAARQMVFNQDTGLINTWILYAFNMWIKILNPALLDAPVKKFNLKDCYVKRLGSIKKSHQSNEKDEVELVVHYENWSYGAPI